MRCLQRFVCWCVLWPLTSFAAAPTVAPAARLTVLYDAFGKASTLEKDWGYSALIEYAGKRILFDTGNNPGILARNAKSQGVDLSKLDFVVLSHRHGDHMGGLTQVLQISSGATIYAPKEGFGVYGSDLPGNFFRSETSLGPEQRYFDGKPPQLLHSGSAWPGARFQLVDKDTALTPEILLITRVSEKAGTLELREVSLALSTPEGMVVVVGCSHPGIEKILAGAAGLNPKIRLVAGGLHLLNANDAEIQATVMSLRETYKVEQIAPGHCTGEPAFAALRKAFGANYRYAGLGTTIALTADAP